MGSKEKRFAAAVLSECEDVNDVDALLKRLEQTPWVALLRPLACRRL